MMFETTRNYKDYEPAAAAMIIAGEIAQSGSSHDWVGAADCPEKYKEVRKLLDAVDIVPVKDDLFGSWVKADTANKTSPDLKDFIMQVKFLVRAEDAEEAKDRWANGEYEEHEILFVDEYKQEKRPPLHLTYYVKNSVLYYKSNEMSGSTPDTDKQRFEKYWTNMFPNRTLTFEDIS